MKMDVVKQNRTEQNRTEQSPFVCLFLKRSGGTETGREKVIDKGSRVVGLTDYMIRRIVHFLWSESQIGSDQSAAPVFSTVATIVVLFGSTLWSGSDQWRKVFS